MTDVDNDLLENERVVYQTRLHWALFLGPAMVIVIGGLSFPAKGMRALILIAIGLAWGIISYFKYNRSLIRVTNKRVLIRSSFLVKKSFTISLSDISFVDFYQPSLGAILNFGRITLLHGGKMKSVFRLVASPGEFVAAVREQVASMRRVE
jgi:membrane protein YdbS with pleckstrin-like domain